jgi:hypothetical protein
LINFGKTFFHQIYFIKVKINSLDQDLDPIYKILFRIINLKKFFIYNNKFEFLDLDIILEVIGVNSELESLKFNKFEIFIE